MHGVDDCIGTGLRQARGGHHGGQANGPQGRPFGRWMSHPVCFAAMASHSTSSFGSTSWETNTAVDVGLWAPRNLTLALRTVLMS